MLLLVRHGRTAWNRDGRLVGRTDVALDDVGEAQAGRVGARLGPVAELRTSPLSRARVTAELLGAGVGPVVDDAFVELDYGSSEGLTLDAVDPAHWARVREDAETRWPGGESLADVQARVAVACAALFSRDGHGARRDDGDVVVVSHVSPIKAAVCWALGADPTVAMRLQLDNGSITTIAWRRGTPVLLSYNVVPDVDAGAGVSRPR
jgi:broad specificity phosphatase PhoE